MVGSHPEMHVACIDSVTFRVANRNEEGEYPEY